MTKQTVPPVSFVNVSVLSASIVAAFADYFVTKEIFKAEDRNVWEVTATGFQSVVASKQVKALHSSVVADAVKEFGNASSGKGKTVRVAADVCSLAIRSGVALFGEDGKVRGRSKIQTECKAIAAKRANKGKPETGTNDGEALPSQGETITVATIHAVLALLAVPETAKSFAPELLKAAEAADMRIATPAEVAVLTAHYLKSQKAA